MKEAQEWRDLPESLHQAGLCLLRLSDIQLSFAPSQVLLNPQKLSKESADRLRAEPNSDDRGLAGRKSIDQPVESNL